MYSLRLLFKAILAPKASCVEARGSGRQAALVDELKGYYVYMTTTDTTGSYLFRSIPPGNYRVEC